jgi:hypothetical protein
MLNYLALDVNSTGPNSTELVMPTDARSEQKKTTMTTMLLGILGQFL